LRSPALRSARRESCSAGTRTDSPAGARYYRRHTVGKAEGAFPGNAPTPEQLAENRAVLEGAGVEFTNGDEPGVKLRRSGPQARLRP
jgi:hypothetical protein